VALVVDQIQGSQPVISALVSEGKAKIIGAYYHIDTGAVEIL
jgi:carbonic anhydrase